VRAWFEDLPLDVARDETPAVERFLRTADPLKVALLAVAQTARPELTRLAQMRPVKCVMRDVLTQAKVSNRSLTLCTEVLTDPRQRRSTQGGYR
jgi:hypothetical protein